MELTLVKTLATAFLLTTLFAQRLVYVYIGLSADTKIPTKIFLYPDILLNTTIISSNDFNCTQALGCSTSGDLKNMTFLNKTFQYLDASAQINLIKQ